jgi:ribosomal protein S18 acetylase RimI-like enzyme
MTPADARWLAWHEARSHGLARREIRDLGDAVLLYDDEDREPFWNRIAGIDWPSDPNAFDRRLAEALALFAGLDRLPHVWPLPGFDQPADLVSRLLANGFDDHGAGMFMILDPGRWTGLLPTPGRGITIERHHLVEGPSAERAAADISTVLSEAFVVEPVREGALADEALIGLAMDEYHACLIRVDGEPAAVARRTSLAGASYLSSIGTRPAFRGRGLGRLVTALVVDDAIRSGDGWIYLGVFESNDVARELYASLGFVPLGGPAPDLLLLP